jgi:light-regulated signal transduction histidine kinase (bacteriophytochrome)
MGGSGPISKPDDVEALRTALDAEMLRCLEIQRQLDGAADDMEEFVSIAAHNLRESLRDVVSFSQLMVEDYDGRLDLDASGFLDRIRAGSDRMQSLLTGMVDYWSTDTREPCPTDMEAVLHQALLSTARQVAEKGAVVTHDPLPHALGDFEILTKVLYHLVRNAIEYNGEPAPRVHISSRREALEWVFSVQDNGPGIDPDFQGRLFGVFKRLHGQEHPGNGLGLAFCKKAIERLGGRIWVESAPGAGANFCFTLPAVE